MSAVFLAIAPVFGVVVLGFVLRKSGLIPSSYWRAVEDLCFWVLFPAILSLTLFQADLSAIKSGPFAASLLVSVAAVSTLLLAAWPLLRSAFSLAAGQFTTIFQTTTRWHGFIGLAIVINLYGNSGAALVAIAFAVLVPVLQVGNILLLASFSSGGWPGVRQLGAIVLRNPILWSVAIGLFINMTGLSIWQPVLKMLDLVGRAALGTSLLALGAGLSIRSVINSSHWVLLGVAGKLVLMPALMLITGTWLGVTGLELGVLLVCGSVPTAMNGYVLARKMGGDAPLYASIATLQTILAMATIPAWLAAAHLWFGAL